MASDSGRIVAVDTSTPVGEGQLKLHAISNAVTSGVRTLASDGHNRAFYSEIFGSTWAIKTLRVEDARAAAATCQDRPDWAGSAGCFDGVEGSIRIANLPGNFLSASQLFSAGTLPTGTPSDLEVLTEDETGKTLDLPAFYAAYLGSFAGKAADPDGAYTFDFAARIDLAAIRGRPTRAFEARRSHTQSAHPQQNLHRRRGLRPLPAGHSRQPHDRPKLVARYRKPLAARPDRPRHRSRHPAGCAGPAAAINCGCATTCAPSVMCRSSAAAFRWSTSIAPIACRNRALPPAAPNVAVASVATKVPTSNFRPGAISGSGPEGIRYTPALEVHAQTGCATGQCRGTGSIDVYSPLLRVGAVHSKSAASDPAALGASEMAACISEVGGQFAQPVDAALANDVLWVDYGLRGDVAGNFTATEPAAAPEPKRHDLLFLALGNAGVFVFDVSDRVLGASTLVGHFRVPNRSALRLQYDAARGLLLIGGSDFSDPAKAKPVIDVWDVRYANAAPGTAHPPVATTTIFAPWTTRHLGFDSQGTGLLYTWDATQGPLVLPTDHPRFTFSGLYVAADAAAPANPNERLVAAETATAVFVPLGVPMQVKAADETAKRFENDKKGTAAFKLRIALPGSFGETLVAKVQSLRALPEERLLGEAQVGEAVALPGGPGWPDQEVTVRLRRVGGASGAAAGESGPLGAAYNLYESVETLLLIADPRAAKAYRRQDAAGEADEEGQCRRCSWPAYLPDPATATPAELGTVKELLAGGRYLRAFLVADGSAGEPVRLATAAAIAFFRAQGANYPLPAGSARVAAAADAVPSPFQVSQAEPAQNAALFSPGEMGVAVALTSGDLLLATTDHAVAGRGLPFSFERSYRSLRLGYGPLGGSGWDAGLFAHLREIETTGEVEYHDGRGQVWRFYPDNGTADIPGEGWDRDKGAGSPFEGGSYYAPTGLYLRLQKLRNQAGWRVIGRDHSIAEFDEAGRLRLLSDRIREAKPVGEQGNSLELRYDAFGKLILVEDDLGRKFRFEYFKDPVADGPRYGLLKSLRDFAGREVTYLFDEERLLRQVQLPEVKNPVDGYAQYSYQGEQRPHLDYEYLGSPSPVEATGLLHGEFAKKRLAAVKLPSFGGFTAPRVRFAYQSSGRLGAVGFPTASNQNSDGSSVAWTFTYSPGTAPAGEAQVKAPWGHEVTYNLEKGRTRELKQQLQVRREDGSEATQEAKTAFTYTEDGRLATVKHPDGGEDQLTYTDAGPAGGAKIDRLSRPNLKQATRKAPVGARGSASYAEIVTSAAYGKDNQVSQLTDGLSRQTEVALPEANKPTKTRYHEGVEESQQINAFGQAKEETGGTNEVKTSYTFGPDAKGKEGAGQLAEIEVGQMFSKLQRDPVGNVERQETSLATSAEALYDEWDRPVREVSGLTQGQLAPVGAAGCALGKGARSERAFDAAGHLVRQRGLQDFVDESGTLQCRWVETRYTYNAREQVVEVRQTQLSDPNQPGAVTAAEQLVSQAVFDPFGRLEESRAINAVDPAVVTRYFYDAAGRGVAAQVGTTAKRVQGFDVKSRVVYRSDGDEAVWQGRFDAWDRLWLEQQPTGAFVQHFYDPANNPTESKVWSRDPSQPQDPAHPENQPVLLKDTRTTYTSFGEMQRTVEVLTTGAEPQVRVTERDFDSAGRVKLVVSGPPGAGDQLDRAKARREKEIQYEPLLGRVLSETGGGLLNEAPLFEQRYEYEAISPWPHQVHFFERNPGSSQLEKTQSTTYRRDAAGRVVEEIQSDGSKMATFYDRMTGQAIAATSGSGATSTVSYDGAGRQLRVTKPNNRGETLYAYDSDGRLRRQVTKTAGADWVTSYGYDAIGRPVRVDYQDGSFATTTWNADSTVATQKTRDGLTLTYSYDAANRPTSVVPSGEVAATLEPLDSGNTTSWDALSRPISQRRGDPNLTVAYPGYDLGSRPSGEKVGSREALGWAWDIYNQPIETRLPQGVGRSAGAFTGFARQYNSLNQLTSIGALGGEPNTVPLGATWSWGGAGRLWGMSTQGTLGTAVRFGYLGGGGEQPPAGNPGEAQWKLGTITWGANPGLEPGTNAAAAPSQIWGQFGFGYRGNQGDPRDGAKVGRLAVNKGKDLFAGIGWSWDYDAGVRLSEASAGRGSLQGSGENEDPSFRYRYGQGDELQQIVDEAAGKITGLETGAYGRITSRNGAPFSYDNAGRRTQDDRFHYKWNWRGELVEVTVKETWPEGQVSPFASHQIRYQYDAQGRLTSRGHLSPPSAQGERQLLEKRAYVWEGQSLLVEAAYTDPAETQLTWRKTYIPGPSGLDDAVQVKVENFAAPGIQGTKLYTYLRDELGTVIGVVGEEENNDPTNPKVPARYLYTPYGEAHIEKGLEVRRIRFNEAEHNLGSQTQQVADPDLQSFGALTVTFAASLDALTLAGGVTVERYTGTEWVALAAADLLVGSGEEASELKVLAKQGWLRGSTYRVRLTTLKDKQGRGLDSSQTFELKIAAKGAKSDFSRTFAVEFESAQASLDTLGGRFPGGQNSLFQGLWTDPVTGIAYARARWYDERNAGWLSEDPLADVDSPNLYAFVGWQPQSRVDQLGLFGVFNDGTWNDRDNVPEGEVATNISRLQDLYAGNSVYINGVGTRTNLLFSLWSGAFGNGMEARVLQGYVEISRAYKRGERDFDIFGFSRGAAESRILVNLIYENGLFDPDQVAVSIQERTFKTREGEIRVSIPVYADKPMVEGKDVRIRFLGLFDTVDSRMTGYFEGLYSNDDQAIPPIVQKVSHAEAVDEYRLSYGLVALQRPDCPRNPRMSVVQFRGSHSDVGGGYFDWTLSLKPLAWMWGQAVEQGVPLKSVPKVFLPAPEMMMEGFGGSHIGSNVHDSTNFWKDPQGYIRTDSYGRPVFYPRKCVGEK